MYLDFKSITPTERYFAMTQSVIPRPIAWILSDNGNESYNLAPYSFFTAICSDPPLVLFSAGKKPSGPDQGLPKDSRKNIEERKSFVIHIANTQSLDALNESAATLVHGDSEISRQGLDIEAFDGFELPRLKECDIAMACTLYRIDEVGNTPQSVIYGEVQSLYVNDRVIDTARSDRLIIDPMKVNPLSRLGGNNYAQLGELLSAARPK